MGGSVDAEYQAEVKACGRIFYRIFLKKWLKNFEPIEIVVQSLLVSGTAISCFSNSELQQSVKQW